MVLPLPGIKPRWNGRHAICMSARKLRADLKVVSVQAHLDKSCFFFFTLAFFLRTSAYYRGEETHQMDETREQFWLATTLLPPRPPLSSLLSPSPTLDSHTLLCFLPPRWSFGTHARRARYIKYYGLFLCCAKMLPTFRGCGNECAVCIQTNIQPVPLRTGRKHQKAVLYVQKHEGNHLWN